MRRAGASFRRHGENCMNNVLPWIIFSLNGRFFAVNSCLVSGIMKLPQITPVPEAPDIFHGICDVRGETIPIFSMHRLLKLPENEGGEAMVVTLSRSEGEQLPCMGFTVDNVISVDNINLIDEKQNTHCLFISRYVFGIARCEKINGDIIVLDENIILGVLEDFEKCQEKEASSE